VERDDRRGLGRFFSAAGREAPGGSFRILIFRPALGHARSIKGSRIKSQGDVMTLLNAAFGVRAYGVLAQRNPMP